MQDFIAWLCYIIADCGIVGIENNQKEFKTVACLIVCLIVSSIRSSVSSDFQIHFQSNQ